MVHQEELEAKSRASRDMVADVRQTATTILVYEVGAGPIPLQTFAD